MEGGGRFLVWEQTGDFGRMPWEGMIIEGYNNGDQPYEAFMDKGEGEFRNLKMVYARQEVVG